MQGFGDKILLHPGEIVAMSDVEELRGVVNDLKLGKTATPVTIRNFLWWFGAQRRTPNNVEYINQKLAEAGVRTVPSYLNIWVDTPITFELISKNEEMVSEAQPQPDGDNLSGGIDDQDSEFDRHEGDPSYTIGEIASANNPPVKVTPNATLLEAKTLMLTRNFSQLPVMTNERDVKGVISWKSIGSRSATDIASSDVRSYMDTHHELPSAASLFSAINTIVEHDYVLIRGHDNKITGIVTATDIALQFETISTPFLLISEIERNLRILISGRLNISDVKQACPSEHLPSSFKSVSDLTFGNYVKILENPACWIKLKLHLDRSTFCSELSEINAVRNDVMHFDPDPITPQDLSKLKNAAKMLNMLRNMGAF